MEKGPKSKGIPLKSKKININKMITRNISTFRNYYLIAFPHDRHGYYYSYELPVAYCLSLVALVA